MPNKKRYNRIKQDDILLEQHREAARKYMAESRGAQKIVRKKAIAVKSRVVFLSFFPDWDTHKLHLPRRRRQAVELRFWGHQDRLLTYQEIGATMGISRQAASKLLGQALAQLNRLENNIDNNL